MKKKRIFIFTVTLLLLVGCVGFVGCSRVDQLINNAKKNIEIDKTLPVYDLNFGWIYSIKDTDSDKTIAVVVNEKYREAVIEE